MIAFRILFCAVLALATSSADDTSEPNSPRSGPTPPEPMVAIPSAPPHRPEPVTDLLSARLLQRPASTTGIGDLPTAYQTQNLLLERLIGKTNLPIGYKIALASPTAQQQFGVTEPISGMLTLSAPPACQGLPLGPFPRLAELEIALVIKEDIRTTPKNILELDRKVSGMRAVIEVPALRFAERPAGYDLITDNAEAAHCLGSGGTNCQRAGTGPDNTDVAR